MSLDRRGVGTGETAESAKRLTDGEAAMAAHLLSKGVPRAEVAT